MTLGHENARFWIPVVALALLAIYVGQKLIRAHIDPQVSAPNYIFERTLAAPRGGIYSVYGREYPFVQSVPCWEYSLDPFDLTNAVVRRVKEPRRPKLAILRTISDSLKMDYGTLKKMADRTSGKGWRNQPLGISYDSEAHRVLADSSLVAGVAIRDHQVRKYLHGCSLAHVLGALDNAGMGVMGIEQSCSNVLTGTAGVVRGMKDARGRELYDRREISIKPVPGSDVYLTIDPNIQNELEKNLKWGLGEYEAATGWGIVMDVHTGAIYAMASFPDFNPEDLRSAGEEARMNRAIAFNYEPGSIMKVLTAATALDALPRQYGPNTLFNTRRDDPRYYKLPGDGSHVWEPTMTLRDAIVHSSNIVIGKLAYDLGPELLFKYFRLFGLGARTGIELPGEQYGILKDPRKKMWDKASRSRAGIGQFVSVTALQMAGAYQAIGNGGVRMRPYIIDRVVRPDGTVIRKTEPKAVCRVVSAETARTVREMMLDVASPKGTARRAAIRGYSVAGKTGTAQKAIIGGHGYAAGLYRASFCGIVPASDPKIVVFITLDFNEKTQYHQGGNSAGPVFKRVALAAIRFLGIPPDRPDEIEESDEPDEYDQLLAERNECDIGDGGRDD